MATKAEQFAKLQDTLQKAWVDIHEYNKAKASWASSADALKAGWYTWTTWTTQTSSWLNAVSQSSLDANKNKAQVWTWAVAWYNDSQQRMQEINNRVEQTNKEIESTKSQLAQKWGWLDYDTQQKKLNTINWLKEWLASKWITSKTQPTTQTTTTTPAKTTTTTKQTTPQQDRWDYQDNSQARMDQIANNLDKYRQTQPWLFEDASAFYNFFIDWKGRSEDQIKYLWDYFNREQEFGKYDNLPASTIWDMLVNWDLWNDYLNHLKATDPAKYQETLSYKQKGEDDIRYESFLFDTADQAWLWSQFEKFYKWIFGYRDENDDKIDDSLYIAPTEEEQTKQNRVNTIDSRVMEIKNMQKNLLDDLVEQYPWVPKATLMWIVQDRTKDLQREYDDLMVERTWLVWNIEYMQNERDMQMDARQKTINNLKTAYWMYYDYTAEWISEMAQNKYAATNVTLDQADQWTETQKQMAIQAALSDYMDKYWDIIQRSEAQIINDVIAYSKQNWVGLAQAFQDNFVTPLKSKTAYKNIQAQLEAAGTTNWIARTKIWQDAEWNDIYWFVDTTNMSVKPYWVDGWEWTTYTPEEVSSDRDKRKAFMSDIANNYNTIEDMANAIAWNMNWLWDWKLECGQYVNDYIYWVTGTQWGFWNEVSQKTSICDNKDKNWIKIWDAIVFNRWISEPTWVKNSTERADLLKYWHVWFITWIDDQWNVTMSHTVWWNVTSTTFNINWNNDYARNFAWSKTVNAKQTTNWWWKWVAATDYVQVSSKNNATQNKTYAFAQRAWEADELIRDYEKKYNWYRDSPIQRTTNRWAWLLWGTTKSEDQKAYEQYKNEFVNAVLRWESWAAIGQTEFSDDEKWAIQRYFPQPWDNLDQITRKQKLRENYISNMMVQAWNTADWVPMSEIYSKNKLSNYANASSSTKQESSYDWMAWF